MVDHTKVTVVLVDILKSIYYTVIKMQSSPKRVNKIALTRRLFGRIS